MHRVQPGQVGGCYAQFGTELAVLVQHVEHQPVALGEQVLRLRLAETFQQAVGVPFIVKLGLVGVQIVQTGVRSEGGQFDQLREGVDKFRLGLGEKVAFRNALVFRTERAKEKRTALAFSDVEVLHQRLAVGKHVLVSGTASTIGRLFESGNSFENVTLQIQACLRQSRRAIVPKQGLHLLELGHCRDHVAKQGHVARACTRQSGHPFRGVTRVLGAIHVHVG
eukprot:466198-Prorocentrum_minimum.AAC.12